MTSYTVADEAGPGIIPANWAPYLLSVLRVIVGFLFIAHGTQKLFGLPGTGTPPTPFDPGSLIGIASILETVGGTLILLGLFIRPVAFLLAGEMAVAYFKVHAPQAFWPLLNKGESPVLFCFIYLFFAAAGGGRWSLDYLLRRGKGSLS